MRARLILILELDDDRPSSPLRAAPVDTSGEELPSRPGLVKAPSQEIEPRKRVAQ